jgi:hypothetical protein
MLPRSGPRDRVVGRTGPNRRGLTQTSTRPTACDVTTASLRLAASFNLDGLINVLLV